MSHYPTYDLARIYLVTFYDNRLYMRVVTMESVSIVDGVYLYTLDYSTVGCLYYIYAIVMYGVVFTSEWEDKE